MSEEIFLSLGANLGDRAANLDRALAGLQEKAVRLLTRSSFYLTDPVGSVEQPQFLNIACLVGTALAPEPLLQTCLALEEEMGRVRWIDKGPRIIDIDILFFGDQLIQTAALTVPHPELHARRFVLAPLKEIAPGFRDPRSGQTVMALYQDCPDRSSVHRLSEEEARRLPSTWT